MVLLLLVVAVLGLLLSGLGLGDDLALEIVLAEAAEEGFVGDVAGLELVVGGLSDELVVGDQDVLDILGALEVDAGATVDVDIVGEAVGLLELCVADDFCFLVRAVDWDIVVDVGGLHILAEFVDVDEALVAVLVMEVEFFGFG